MDRLAAFAVMLFCWPVIALGHWELKAVDSTFQYATVKNGSKYEINSFEQMSGAISSSGIATLKVELASVNTGISIRDSRMKTMLFDLIKFPAAVVTLPVDTEQLMNMDVGELWPLSTGGKLNLNGEEQTVLAELHVYRISAERWLVKTAQPVIVDASNFKLVKGIEALREVAGLKSIMPMVPVHLELVFEKI